MSLMGKGKALRAKHQPCVGKTDFSPASQLYIMTAWDGGIGRAPPSKGPLGTISLGRASRKAASDLVFLQVAADEDDAARAFFAGTPLALDLAIEDHVDALEDIALRV